MSRQSHSTSSAFPIHNRRILTNAHTVSNHTVVRVKKRSCAKKYIAQVMAIAKDCDLALLTVEENSFWDSITPLSFGPPPLLRSPVVVIGYPIGGENISVTAGVVSRIDLHIYELVNSLLVIQIDAAINAGNSGGPALNEDGKVVGIAFQSFKSGSSENIGYLVPSEVVNRFLIDFERNGMYTGLAYCGFEWQSLENSSMRRSLHMGPADSGVLVRRVLRAAPTFGVLQEDDVVTGIDGIPISNDGTVPFYLGDRISFHYIFTTKFVGESLTYEFQRAGELKTAIIRLQDVRECLLLYSTESSQRRPPYFTFAGLVFISLTTSYLKSEYGGTWTRGAPIAILKIAEYGIRDKEGEEVVILAQVLNAHINIEYDHIVDQRVHKVNGKVVFNLRHLAQIVQCCTDRFIRFDLEEDIIVFDREEASQASQEICQLYSIPAESSFDELGGSV